MLSPTRLTCEFLENPIGIDKKKPRLGWILSSKDGERGKLQSAYKILVASSKEHLSRDDGDIWDSGKINSDSSCHVKYNGTNLKSREVYFWKVKIWDEKGKESDWSKESSWRMGIFPEDWKGEWIGARENVSFDDRFPVSKDLVDCPEWIKPAARREHPHGPGPENDYAMAVYLQKEINVTGEIDRATICIAGLGYHEVKLNGKKVGNHVLDPGATDYTKTVLYVSHDVTGHLIQGRNHINIILGNGWYWVGTPDLFGFEKADWATPPRCRFELEIIYKNGEKQHVHSDDTWKCSENGPIRFNCIRSGEVYDARMEEIQDWKPVKLVLAPLGCLTSQISPPMRVNDKFAPMKRVLLDDDKIVYWFPKNNAGWVEIKVRGNKGQKIVIELNEMLKEDGSVDMQKHSGHTYGRYQTCEYICKGEGIETWHPRFCYAGFQYIQITGAKPDQILEIMAHQVGTSFRDSGKFHCSNLLINEINEASKLTFKNGFHSYPEDCPQREKAGWTEDALISAHGSVYNHDALLAYEKWIQDIMDAQHEVGQVPDIVPTPLWGKPTKIHEKGDYNPWTGEEIGNMADPWWGGTLVMLPWKLYEHYGDVEILERAYPSMKRYVDFLLRTTQYGPDSYDYMINWTTMLGEWLEVGSGGSATRTPRILTCTQAFYKCATVVSKVASLLKNDADEKLYNEISENISAALNEEFLYNSHDNNITGVYWPDSQSAQAMSLVLGLVPEKHEGKVFDVLVKNVLDERKGHLSTGIVGTYFLYKALGQWGRPDVAFQVITAKGFPGFEHNLTRVNANTPVPSGTIWEDWGGRSSLAHPVQGTVVSFFYEYLAGIQWIEPGFKKFKIAPCFVSGLEWVKAGMETLYGRIKLEWKIEGDTLEMKLKIPANTIAEIWLPTGVPSEIIEGKNPINEVKGLKIGIPKEFINEGVQNIVKK
ncbi:MAG: family 78 glycoside hydrolase catalytic domain, partial [Candidatus Hodarchaeota archaeon]